MMAVTHVQLKCSSTELPVRDDTGLPGHGDGKSPEEKEGIKNVVYLRTVFFSVAESTSRSLITAFTGSLFKYSVEEEEEVAGA